MDLGESLLFHSFYFLPLSNSTKLNKDNFSTELGDKISKGQVFCRQEGRGQELDNDIEFNQGQGQLYNQGFQSQKSVAEKQPPEKQHNNINLGGGKEEKLGAGGRGVEGGGHRGGEGGL